MIRTYSHVILISNTIKGYIDESALALGSTNAEKEDDRNSATEPRLTNNKINDQNDDTPQISSEETGTHWHLVNVHLQFCRDQDLLR